ncbi:MAG TPA: PDZ domain-containing protein [Acidobacteriaceae bacterium]|nr:PDZ domain-containing protein [Acidobacteriaceae bacterium]
MMDLASSKAIRANAPLGGARSEMLLTAVVLCSFALAAMTPPAHGAVAAGHASSKEHSRGYLGITYRDTSDERAVELHLQGAHGAEIIMVDHDGPAGKAGLQPHDVVLQVDGQNIENAEDLSKRIRNSAPGKVFSMSIMRLGRPMNLTAKLADQRELERAAWQQHLNVPEPKPDDDGVDNILVQRYSVETAPPPRTESLGRGIIGTVLRSGPYTGASLEAMEPQLAGFFGAPPKTGLLVNGVDPNSPAAFAGLKAGDVVLKVDAAPVASGSDWTKRMRASSGRAVTLTILRDKHEQSLTMQPDLKRHSMLEWPNPF